MTSVKMFPILIGYQGTKFPCPSAIPWDAIAPYDGQARSNHGGQSLEWLAERGGLSPIEAFLVMNGRSWSRTVFSEELSREACAFLDKVVRDREQIRADMEEIRLHAFDQTLTDTSRVIRIQGVFNRNDRTQESK